MNEPFRQIHHCSCRVGGRTKMVTYKQSWWFAQGYSATLIQASIYRSRKKIHWPRLFFPRSLVLRPIHKYLVRRPKTGTGSHELRARVVELLIVWVRFGLYLQVDSFSIKAGGGVFGVGLLTYPKNRCPSKSRPKPSHNHLLKRRWLGERKGCRGRDDRYWLHV